MVPDPGFRPAVKPLKDAVPVAKLRWQEPPRRPAPHDPQHRVNEQPVIGSADTSIPFLPWHQILDQRPLLVRQLAANQDCLPRIAVLNHFSSPMGIP